MNNDASNFMLQEYSQIASAYFGLRDQVNQWFKTYIALISVPLTALTAITKLNSDSELMSITELPSIVSTLLIVVAFLGFFVNLSIVSMRMEMIQYARTINNVRRYFAVCDFNENPNKKEDALINFLILPTSDTVPPFYESGRAMFWQVIMMGFLNGSILCVSIFNLSPNLGWGISIIVGIFFLGIHWLIYWWMAKLRKKNWKTHYKDNLIPPNH